MSLLDDYLCGLAVSLTHDVQTLLQLALAYAVSAVDVGDGGVVSCCFDAGGSELLAEHYGYAVRRIALCVAAEVEEEASVELVALALCSGQCHVSDVAFPSALLHSIFCLLSAVCCNAVFVGLAVSHECDGVLAADVTSGAYSGSKL